MQVSERRYAALAAELARVTQCAITDLLWHEQNVRVRGTELDVMSSEINEITIYKRTNQRPINYKTYSIVLVDIGEPPGASSVMQAHSLKFCEWFVYLPAISTRKLWLKEECIYLFD
jgi:hypothetical protein